MPTYDWFCPVGHDWSVVTTVNARNDPSNCPKCGAVGTRGLTVPQISPTAGDWNRVEYNPGLGQYTKSWKHARQIAKEKNLIEVGNEPVDSIHKYHETVHKDNHDRRWAEVDREKVYD